MLFWRSKFLTHKSTSIKFSTYDRTEEVEEAVVVAVVAVVVEEDAAVVEEEDAAADGVEE